MLTKKKARQLAEQSRERGDSIVARFVRRLDDIAADVAEGMEDEFESPDKEPEDDEEAQGVAK